MKKALSIILITVMLVASLSACTSEKEEVTATGTPVETQAPSANDNNSSENNSPNTNDNEENNEEGTKESNKGNGTATTDEAKFEAACKLIANGKIEEAYSALKELTNYAPAKEKLKNFVYAPTTVKDMYGGEKTYEYNAYGDLVSITDENGEKFSFTYNANGDVLTGYNIIHPSNSEPCIYSYKDGKLSYYTIANTKKVSHEYNDKGYVSKQIIKDLEYDSTVEIKYEYTYYENGAVKTLSSEDPVDGIFYVFEYNEQGQMTKQTLGEIDDEVETFYIILSYNEYGYSGAELFGSEALCEANGFPLNEPIYVYECSYDRDGKLVDYRISYTDGVLGAYSYTSHQLCYVENPSTLDRINTIYGIDPSTQLS